MFSQTELLYSIARTIYVTTCLTFSIVRCFYVCPEAKADKSYYYPDRKVMALLYAIPSILFPYILNPNSHTSWLLVKGYYPLTHFFYCSILLFNYFGKIKNWKRWYISGIVSAFLVFIPLSVLFAIAISPIQDINICFENALENIFFSVGILMTIYCGISMWKIWQWVSEYSTDNFSNIDDFPLAYARGVLIIPVIHALLIWPTVLVNTPMLMAVMQILLSVFNVFFLISILQTKRNGKSLMQIKEEKDELNNINIAEQVISTNKELAKDNKTYKTIPEQTYKKIVLSIDRTLTHQRLYLNPNLRLKDIAESCDYCQTYVSKIFKEQYGGFFDYVNMLRCRHVDEYLAKHPDVTKEEAIYKSGFKDRQTYYRIKKLLCSNKQLFKRGK